jgi:hypothetical protein
MRVEHDPPRPFTECPTYACTLPLEHHERQGDDGQTWHHDDTTGVHWPTGDIIYDDEPVGRQSTQHNFESERCTHCGDNMYDIWPENGNVDCVPHPPMSWSSDGPAPKHQDVIVDEL